VNPNCSPGSPGPSPGLSGSPPGANPKWFLGLYRALRGTFWNPPGANPKWSFGGPLAFLGASAADPPGGIQNGLWGSPGLCPGVFGIPPGANRILRAPPRLNLKRCFKDFVLPPRGHKELQALGGKQSQGQKLCITFFQIHFWNLGASAALNPKSC
jgi:hypothetical protein